MPACRYHEFCSLTDDADPAAGLCILHSRQMDKDSEIFINALRVHSETQGDRFIHMVLPMQVDFTGMTFSEAVCFRDTTFSGMVDF
jgi:hypothetical protein